MIFLESLILKPIFHYKSFSFELTSFLRVDIQFLLPWGIIQAWNNRKSKETYVDHLKRTRNWWIELFSLSPQWWGCWPKATHSLPVSPRFQNGGCSWLRFFAHSAKKSLVLNESFFWDLWRLRTNLPLQKFKN